METNRLAPAREQIRFVALVFDNLDETLKIMIEKNHSVTDLSIARNIARREILKHPILS